MKTSDAIDQIAVALAAAQAEIEAAPKDKVNPHFKSRYADLASIWDACKAALGKNGLAVIQSPSVTESRHLRLTTRLLHKSGQWLESDLDLKPMKDDPQAMGSAITYARRYALSAMVGVVSEEDDDGNAASARNQKPATPPVPPPPPKPVIFDKESKEHLGWISKLTASGNIPDGIYEKLISALHGKEWSKEMLAKAIVHVSVGGEEKI